MCVRTGVCTCSFTFLTCSSTGARTYYIYMCACMYVFMHYSVLQVASSNNNNNTILLYVWSQPSQSMWPSHVPVQVCGLLAGWIEYPYPPMPYPHDSLSSTCIAYYTQVCATISTNYYLLLLWSSTVTAASCQRTLLWCIAIGNSGSLYSVSMVRQGVSYL